MREAARLEAVLAYTRLALAVDAALARGERPATGDAVADAYDFRPPVAVSRPSTRASLKALEAAGWKRPRGFDAGVFVSEKIEYIAMYCSYYCGVKLPQYRMAHILVGYRHYRELTEGRKTRWKLIRVK